MEYSYLCVGYGKNVPIILKTSLPQADSHCAGLNTGVRAYFAAFEPGFFAGEGHWFCANVYWDGKTIVKQRIGSQQQDYLQHKWYKKGIIFK